MKERDTIVVGCGVGMCALLSAGCKLAKSVLDKLDKLWKGKGEEKGSESGG